MKKAYLQHQINLLRENVAELELALAELQRQMRDGVPYHPYVPYQPSVTWPDRPEEPYPTIKC